MVAYETYAKLRDERGMKDSDVCSASGVASATISSWKAGNYTPKLDKLMRIAGALGVSITDLIEEAS